MPKKIALTPQQGTILNFVRQYQAKRGFPPTRREVCKRFDWKSPNAAQEQLRAIERKGWIRIWPTPRGISVL